MKKSKMTVIWSLLAGLLLSLTSCSTKQQTTSSSPSGLPITSASDTTQVQSTAESAENNQSTIYNEGSSGVSSLTSASAQKTDESRTSGPTRSSSTRQSTKPVISSPTKTATTTEGGAATVPSQSNVLRVTAKNVTISGRSYLEGGDLAFCNSNAGIRFGFKGTALSVDFASTAYVKNEETYANVFIDDREPVTIKIGRAGYQVIATGLQDGVVHQVRIAKRSEDNIGAMIIRNLKINVGGTFTTAEEPKTNRRILVLGDSITCGYGNLYESGESPSAVVFEDGTNTFATMLAERCQAELEVVAISGIGIGNSRNTPFPLQPVYEQEDNRSKMPLDTKRFVPDLVVISLGTNDDAQNATQTEIRDGTIKFIRKIHEDFPKAKIVWTYGIMSRNCMQTLQNTIDELIAAGDKQLAFVPLEAPRGEELPMGLAGHPNLKMHARMAEELLPAVKKLTGWK